MASVSIVLALAAGSAPTLSSSWGSLLAAVGGQDWLDVANVFGSIGLPAKGPGTPMGGLKTVRSTMMPLALAKPPEGAAAAAGEAPATSNVRAAAPVTATSLRAKLTATPRSVPIRS